MPRKNPRSGGKNAAQKERGRLYLRYMMKRLEETYELYHQRYADLAGRPGRSIRKTSKTRRIWRKVALRVLEKKLHPGWFIRAGFESVAYNVPPPSYYLCDSALEDYYKRYDEESRVYKARIRFNSEQTQLFVQIGQWQRRLPEKERLLRFVLFCKHLEISPLMRYCVAVDEGLEDVAEFYRTPAILQYLEDPKVYDLVWEKWLPNGFREEAIRTAFDMRAAAMAQLAEEDEQELFEDE